MPVIAARVPMLTKYWSMSPPSGSRGLTGAHEALRAQQQREDEQHERDYGLVIGADVQRAHLHGDADEQGTGHGAVRLANAAEDRGGEHDQQELEAHGGVQAAGAKAEHESRQAGYGSSEDPGPVDDLRRV